ncbi:MAG: helicase-related protein [Kocuria sp.]|uniref:DEAD/DEAH box helicase n=1 Tax=Kocuria sp. TaxID=1871328 RepID=UPI0026DB97BB|nr:DEAD/DEAH box helicase [Kocuria sp.]MDO4256338.1 helicase-related protein [Kocuria sp.]
MTPSTALEEIVFASHKFRDVLDAARKLTVRSEFAAVEWSEETPSIDWGFALLYASAITSAQSERAQSAVLRIATACTLSPDAEDAHKAAAAALLERSGNHMAVELAESRDRLPADAWGRLPGALRMEVVRSRIDYSVRLSDGRVLPVNPFQGKFLEAVETNDWLSVSAPTSAGKSRIVREHFLEVARQAGPLTLVYLVPTRALIEEVSRDLGRELPSDVDVFTMPWDPDLAESQRTVLVVTQERLHLVLELLPSLSVDLLFVDEAQSLAGDARGVLLQHAIERTVRRSPEARVLFASPLSSNPELLVEDAPADRRSDSFVSETVTVNQNLLWVEHINRKPQRRAVSLVSDGNSHKVGELVLAQRATTVPMRIALVAHALAGSTPGNVIYVNGPSEAENVAKAIYEQLPALAEADTEIDDLRDLIKTAVHSKYLLADVLARRVAFHYGNMPLVVRTEIERLFGEGKIHYLVCTSTLLEGVNLPCRTIFMRNPQKGPGNPLREGDFWNLAGRAGRWGKEFEGNVVCIDTDDESLWPNLPRVRKRSQITRAVRTGLDDASGLLTFVRSVDEVHDDSASESLFAYLCSRQLAGESIQHLLDRISLESERGEVESAVARAASNLTIPVEVVTRHTGIAPISMERLLESFRRSGKTPTELELPLPEERDARARFQEAFVRIGATMTSVFGAPRSGEDLRKWQLANLVVNWMKGMPLSRLIDQRLSSNASLTSARAIRDVMRDIESIARFHAPKYLACYADLLEVYSTELGLESAARPDYAMMLELGVSRTSEVVLMSLGLSRTATVALANFIGVDTWSRAEALAWLAAQNLDGLGVPVLLQREISDVLEVATRRGEASPEAD